MRNLQDLRLFVESAHLGSFSACAKSLNTSPAAVSAAIKRLEDSLQTLLFVRSTRSLRLTQQGEQFLPHCQQAISIIDYAIAELKNDTDQDLQGKIRLSAPSALGRSHIVTWLDHFIAQHPKVDIELECTDSPTDLYKQSIDLAVRYGSPKDSSLIALPIIRNNPLILCASPAYLSAYGQPDSIEALSNHNCLCYGVNNTLLTHWVFTQGDYCRIIAVSGNRSSNDSGIIYHWAKCGYGITLASALDICDQLQNGTLVQIKIDGWQGGNLPLNLIYAHKRIADRLVETLHRHFVTCALKAYSALH